MIEVLEENKQLLGKMDAWKTGQVGAEVMEMKQRDLNVQVLGGRQKFIGGIWKEYS